MNLDYKQLKIDFKVRLNNVLEGNKALKYLLFEIFEQGSAYVVGGFLRDIINHKDSRDIDMIIDLDHATLIKIIKDSGQQYEVNRHRGIKLSLNNIQVDMWSIENNWAFKNKLVKLNEENKLESIAKGCFYNFDSLVINVHNNNLNIKHYIDFINKKELDILQNNPQYKILNPTIEANILRAFYLKKNFNIDYTANTKMYLFNKLGQLRDKGNNPKKVLIETKIKYPKYAVLSDSEISALVDDVIIDSQINNQMLFNL